jgi:hypothetical protein
MIQLADTTLCVDAGPKPWKNMGIVSLKECSTTEAAQQWTAMADGRIALTASPGTRMLDYGACDIEAEACSPVAENDMLTTIVEECIDLQYMKAVQNNPVGIYDCAGLNNIGAADKGINWPLRNATLAMMFAA